MWGNNQCNNRVKNWNFRVHTKFKEVNMEHFCNIDTVFDIYVIRHIESINFEKYKENWYSDLMLQERSKLRTNRLFKQNYGTEKYLLTNIPGKYKSALAKFRCGVAPLKIETGRYEGIIVENRTCFNPGCSLVNCIEDEKHVLLKCPVYADLRCNIFSRALEYNDNFMQLSDDEKFIFLLNDDNMCFYTAKVCYDMLFKRKCILYR